MIFERLETVKRPLHHVVIFAGVVPDQRYPLRLHGGQNQYVGEVQVNVNGIWGALCAGTEGSFSQVLCKTLGFKRSEGLYRINSTNTSLLLYTVHCHPRRSTPDLYSCDWNWYTEDLYRCSSKATLGVVCSDGKHSVALLPCMLGVNWVQGI